MSVTDNLTYRDLRIIKLIALGRTREEVAQELQFKSVKTLEFHLNGTENANSIKKRFGINSPSDFTHFAIEHKLIKPGEKYADPNQPTGDNGELLDPIDINGIEDLKAAVLRGAALAANGKANAMQINSLCQCSDAYIRICRIQLDVAIYSGKHLPAITDQMRDTIDISSAKASKRIAKA